MGTTIRQKKASKTVTASELYASYMDLGKKSGQASSVEREGVLNALLRNLMFKGSLSEDAMDHIVSDSRFSSIAWRLWYSEISASLAEGEDYVPGDSARMIIESMVTQCSDIPDNQMWLISSKAVIFLRSFPFAVPQFTAMVMSGKIPASVRLLEYLGNFNGMDPESVLSIKPYDLKAVLAMLKHCGKSAQGLLHTMIENIERLERSELLSDTETLTEIFSQNLSSAVFMKIRHNCVGNKGIPESLYHQALLGSTVSDKRARRQSLLFFKSTQSLSFLIKLGGKTVIPDDVMGADLCGLLAFLDGCVEGYSLLEGVPDDDTFKARAIDLLLSGAAKDKERYELGKTALLSIIKSKEPISDPVEA